MAEAPKSGAEAEAKAEGVPKAEQEVVKSPEEARDQLLSLAEGSLAGLNGVLKILEGTSKDAAAEQIRADAGIKLEELKELFAKLLAGKEGAEKADEGEEEEKAAEEGEASKEKEVGFEVGNKISWKNKKGEVLEGEVMAVEGHTAKDGTPQVSVRVDGKTLTFLIGVDKLTKLESDDEGEAKEEKTSTDKVKISKSEKGQERETKLRDLISQLEKAAGASGTEGFAARKAALEAAADTLGMEELKTVLSKDKNGGALVNESIEKAIVEAEAQLRSGQEEAEEEVDAEDQEKEKTAVEKAAEKVAQLRALIDQITKALEYIDGGKETVAKGHDLVKEAILAAGGALEDEDLQALLDNKRAGTKQYKEALEGALGRVEGLLRDAEQALKNAEAEAENESESGESKAEKELNPEALIDACQNWDELMEAINQIGDFEGSDGTIHPADVLVKAILTIKTVEERGGFVGPNSPMINLITRTHGLRDKVKELLNTKEVTDGEDVPVPPEGEVPAGQEGEPTPFELSKNDYADSKAKLFKGFGGILGLPKRLINRKGYKEAQENLEASREAFEAERNKLVMENIDNLLMTESALADETMARMGETKRIPGISWAYDQWKKLGKYRLVASAALLGIGVVSGMAGAGAAVAGGIYVGRKILTLGGVSTAFGTYETLTNWSDKGVLGMGGEAPKIKLSGDRLADETAEKRNLQQKYGRIRFGKKKKAYNEEYQAMMSGLQEEEIQDGAAEKWDDDQLNKSIAYYESETPFRGQKPSENPTYMALLREKANRLKGALEAGMAGAEGERTEAQQRYEEEMVGAQTEKVQEKISEVKNYIKQWYLTEYPLFETMKNVAVEGETKEERQAARKETDEYKAWFEATQKIKADFDSLPEEVQTVLLRAEGDQRGRRAGMQDLLESGTAETLYNQGYNDVKADAVWEADWKLNPAVEAELDQLLRANEALMVEAEEGARERIQVLVSSVEAQEQKIQATREAVMNSLTAGLNEHDKAVEDRTKTAVRRDMYRKMVAVMAAVAINTDLVRNLFTGGEGGGETPPEPDGGGGGGETPPEPDGGGGGGETPPEPDGGGGGGETPPEPGGGGGGEVWVPEEEGFTPWDPELSDPTVGENLDGVFGKGDGVINVARDLGKANPTLFEGMTDSQLNRTILRKLMDTTLPNGEPALLWDAEKGWGYNFTFHPGDDLTFTTDADGHFTGFDTEDFRPRKVTNWRAFGGVKLEDLGEVSPAELDNTLIENANKMNELADEIYEAKGGVPDEVYENPIIGDNDSASMADRLEFASEQEKFIEMQKEHLADLKSVDQAIETGGELVPDAEVVAEAPLSESSPIKVQTDKFTGMVDIHQEGGQTRVFVKGKAFMWDKDLHDEGILKEKAYTIGHETHGGNRNFNRSAVRELGRRVYVLDSALDELRSTGQTERAALLEDYIGKVKTGAEKRYGDIFQ